MKTNLLLIGFLLFIIKTHAQVGIQSVYYPYLLNSKKKALASQRANVLLTQKLDSVIFRSRPLFLQYTSKRKEPQAIIFANTGFQMAKLNANQAINEIDLEKTKNRAKQLFFKMKMWRYFRE